MTGEAFVFSTRIWAPSDKVARVKPFCLGVGHNSSSIAVSDQPENAVVVQTRGMGTLCFFKVGYQSTSFMEKATAEWA